MSTTIEKKPVQTNTQSRNPRARKFVKDDDKHYVLVEKGEQLDKYLYIPSYVNAEDPLYEVASEDRGATGSGNMVLLSMSQENYIQMQVQNRLEAEGKGSMSEFSKDDAPNVTSEVTTGGPLSI